MKKWVIKFIATAVILYCFWTSAKMIMFHDCEDKLIWEEIEKWQEIK